MNIETLYFLVETIAVAGFYGAGLLGSIAILFGYDISDTELKQYFEFTEIDNLDK